MIFISFLASKNDCKYKFSFLRRLNNQYCFNYFMKFDFKECDYALNKIHSRLTTKDLVIAKNVFYTESQYYIPIEKYNLLKQADKIHADTILHSQG